MGFWVKGVLRKRKASAKALRQGMCANLKEIREKIGVVWV